MNLAVLEKKLRSETGYNWTIGLSTLISPHDPASGVEEILSAGVGVRRIEIALAKQLEKEENTVSKLRRLKEENDLIYSVHAPFLYDNLAHPKDRIREIYVEEGVKAIDLAASIGAHQTVFHPGELFFRNNLPPLEVFKPFRKSRESYLKSSLASLRKLAKHGSRKEVNLLVENLPHGLCDRSDEISYLLSRLQGSEFILDIGHANISESLEELLGLEPKYFHFNDNDGESDEHLPLGKGNINIEKLMDLLQGYPGDKTIILELYSLDDLLASLEVLKKSLI